MISSLAQIHGCAGATSMSATSNEHFVIAVHFVNHGTRDRVTAIFSFPLVSFMKKFVDRRGSNFTLKRLSVEPFSCYCPILDKAVVFRRVDRVLTFFDQIVCLRCHPRVGVCDNLMVYSATKSRQTNLISHQSSSPIYPDRRNCFPRVIM